MACEDILQQLNDAIAARQRLITGASVAVIVDAFRSRVEYKQSDLPSLTAEVQRLQAEYNSCIACANHTRVQPSTRPVRFIF